MRDPLPAAARGVVSAEITSKSIGRGSLLPRPISLTGYFFFAFFAAFFFAGIFSRLPLCAPRTPLKTESTIPGSGPIRRGALISGPVASWPLARVRAIPLLSICHTAATPSQDLAGEFTIPVGPRTKTEGDAGVLHGITRWA